MKRFFQWLCICIDRYQDLIKFGYHVYHPEKVVEGHEDHCALGKDYHVVLEEDFEIRLNLNSKNDAWKYRALDWHNAQFSPKAEIHQDLLIWELYLFFSVMFPLKA